MLEVKGLAKSWPGFGLSLELSLAEGEVLAVLGPSGCGKSTLLRLVAGLERPDAGRLFLGGREITGLPPERRGIGMVFQDLALFPHLSVRRNIEYAPRMRGLPRGLARETAEALAASFEISPILDRDPYSLSGGEQQRVALARALAARPALMLLDEPLSSLDASLRRRLRSEIAERIRRAGIAAILVTHDAEEALAVADRIALMRAGRIEAEGFPQELYDAPPTAWSAAFLGRGPVLEILSLEDGEGSALALTPLGHFRCANRGAGAVGKAASLFFPAEAPRSAQRATASEEAAVNRLSGRVASSYFAGRYRRVALDCPIAAGPSKGGNFRLEIELPSPFVPRPGERLELEIPEESCFALP